MPLLVGLHHCVVLSLLLFCIAVLIQLHGVFHANNAYVQQVAFVLMWFPAAIAGLEYAYASMCEEQNNSIPVLTNPPAPSSSDVATSPSE
jgi:hypothetical protein